MRRKPGLGTAHDKARALAWATFVDGTACPYGRRCLYWPNTAMRTWMALDLSHAVDRAVSGGTDDRAALAHARCNRSWGSRAQNRRQAARRAAGLAPARRKPAARKSRW